MIPKDEALFGRIAVHNKLIDKRQLEKCTNDRETGTQAFLGLVMIERGYINAKQYRAIEKARVAHLAKKGRQAVPAPSPDEVVSRSKKKSGRRSGRKAAAAEGATTTIEKQGRTAIATATPPATPRPTGAISKVQPSSQPRQWMIDLLTHARRVGASDLHLSCGARPFVRKDGDINYLDLPMLDRASARERILSILSEKGRRLFEERKDYDTCLELKGLGRFRTNVLVQRRGVSAVFRVINEQVPTLEELGLPDSLKKFTTFHQGLVLVTGAAGSGKSSTLAALVEIINRTRAEHIITLEDPVEYIFECKKANVTQRQVELHTDSWAKALRASLREDPDVIMVGEMRDLETISLAITAAETGHLVLATLHTTNATRTIDRLLDVFPPKEQAQIRAMVSESLRGIISQQLVPRSDGQGRVPALEVLFSTPAVGNLIREKRTFQLFSVLQTGRRLGMRLMDDSLDELLKQGLVDREEVLKRAQNRKRFEQSN